MDLTRNELLALCAMAFGLIMDGLDSSIVNIAIPVIAEEFGTDTNSIAWVSIIYFMMIAGLMLTFGRIADSGPIRKTYIIGFAIFSASSLVCGLSDNLGMLVFARGIQGVGAAMLGAIAPMICVKFLPPQKIGLAMSALMVAGSIGFGLGPLVGGVIIDLASWQWAFFINIPIGLIAIAFALKALPKDEKMKDAKLDLKGSMLLFVSVLSGVYILEMFSQPGQDIICLALVPVMIVCLALFVLVEKKVPFRMLNLGMFKDRMFNLAVICYLLMNLTYVGAHYLLPFYITMELGLSPTMTGAIILVPSVVTLIVSIPSGRYCDTHGRRLFSVLSCLFLLFFCVGYALVEPGMGWLILLPLGCLGGLMWGTCGASVTSRVIDLAPAEDKGMASTLSNFLYYVGGSLGTALFASLITFGSGTIGVPLEEIPLDDFMTGYHFTMYIAIAISIIATLCAWAINEKRIRSA